MMNCWIVAANEFRAGLRNRMVLTTILVLAALALILSLFGSTPIGETRASSISVISVSLASLSIYLIPLLALLLGFDTIVGESERGTLLLLLTYPLARYQLLLGKFCGQLFILGLAVLLGYGSVGIYLGLTEQASFDEWRGYCAMMFSSVLLGAVFLAAGALISVLAKERSTAIGAAIAVWIFAVVLYDLGLLVLLVTDTGHLLQGDLLATLITLNPTDAYRLFNITLLDSTAAVAGMVNVEEQSVWSPTALIGLLIAWCVVLLLTSIRVFNAKEL